MKRLTLTVGALAAGCALLAASVPSVANAAPGADPKKPTKVVLYAENRGIARVDNNASGALEHGDSVNRELAISQTPGGKVIGVSYSQAEIVAYNPEAKVDVRRVHVINQLPGGDLITEGLSNLPIGSVPGPGWKDTYAIIGGTGKYAGVRGTEQLTLMADGKTFKKVLTLFPYSP